MKSCFVISPIGAEDSQTRRDADEVLEYIIKPVLAECGYETIRADNITETGLISQQIIQRIIQSDLVIADLSGGNPNVFYELAIRHAARKPFIQIIRDGENLPFDISHQRTVFYKTDSIGAGEQAKTRILALLKSTEENPNEIESPIDVALISLELRSSSNPLDQGLADIVDTLGQHSSRMSSMLSHFSHVMEDLERKTNQILERTKIESASPDAPQQRNTRRKAAKEAFDQTDDHKLKAAIAAEIAKYTRPITHAILLKAANGPADPDSIEWTSLIDYAERVFKLEKPTYAPWESSTKSDDEVENSLGYMISMLSGYIPF